MEKMLVVLSGNIFSSLFHEITNACLIVTEILRSVREVDCFGMIIYTANGGHCEILSSPFTQLLLLKGKK